MSSLGEMVLWHVSSPDFAGRSPWLLKRFCRWCLLFSNGLLDFLLDNDFDFILLNFLGGFLVNLGGVSLTLLLLESLLGRGSRILNILSLSFSLRFFFIGSIFLLWGCLWLILLFLGLLSFFFL